jgi:hypothetical protein
MTAKEPHFDDVLRKLLATPPQPKVAKKPTKRASGVDAKKGKRYTSKTGSAAKSR